MKQVVFSLIVLFYFKTLNSQVVFCPPGAEWNYEFSITIFSPTTIHEKIIYSGYTVVNGDTIKTLNHFKFYTYCNEYHVTTTFIKQKGDTIFFQNSRTQNTWQILYNFAAQVGGGWQTSVINGFNAPVTFAYIVDSIAYLNVNGYSLKRMYLNQKSQIITERFGNSGFLFNFPSSISDCDGDYLVDNLCYSDSAFGTQQFTSKPCNYTFGLGINSSNQVNKNVNFYPIPVSDKLNLKTSSEFKYTQIRISNLFGSSICQFNKELSKDSILSFDLSELQTGIYFIELIEEGRVIHSQKIMKE